MKRIILFLLILTGLQAAAQQTYWPSAPPGFNALPTFAIRWMGVTPDSLDRYVIVNPLTGKANEIYTATYINANFSRGGGGGGAIPTNGLQTISPDSIGAGGSLTQNTTTDALNYRQVAFGDGASFGFDYQFGADGVVGLESYGERLYYDQLLQMNNGRVELSSEDSLGNISSIQFLTDEPGLVVDYNGNPVADTVTTYSLIVKNHGTAGSHIGGNFGGIYQEGSNLVNTFQGTFSDGRIITQDLSILVDTAGGGRPSYIAVQDTTNNDFVRFYSKGKTTNIGDTVNHGRSFHVQGSYGYDSQQTGITANDLHPYYQRNVTGTGDFYSSNLYFSIDAPDYITSKVDTLASSKDTIVYGAGLDNFSGGSRARAVYSYYEGATANTDSGYFVHQSLDFANAEAPGQSPEYTVALNGGAGSDNFSITEDGINTSGGRSDGSSFTWTVFPYGFQIQVVGTTDNGGGAFTFEEGPNLMYAGGYKGGYIDDAADHWGLFYLDVDEHNFLPSSLVDGRWVDSLYSPRNSAKDTIAGSVSGSVIWSQPNQNSTLKTVIADCRTLVGTTNYVLPTGYTSTMVITYQSPGVTLTASTIASSHISITTTAAGSGLVIFQGY